MLLTSDDKNLTRLISETPGKVMIGPGLPRLIVLFALLIVGVFAQTSDAKPAQSGSQTQVHAANFHNRRKSMKREIIRVEPLSTYLEKWKAPTSAVSRCNGFIFVSGFPPFDKDTGEIIDAPIEEQTRVVMEQMKLCVETAGSSMDHILKVNIYCTSVEKFAAVNEIYKEFFPNELPPRIFITVPKWPGHFDIEVDCVASVKD